MRGAEEAVDIHVLPDQFLFNLIRNMQNAQRYRFRSRHDMLKSRRTTCLCNVFLRVFD